MLHFWSIFRRIVHGMPILVSSNWASWFILVGTFFLTEGLLLWRERRHMREWWTKRWSNLALGLSITAFVYAGLFLWSTVQTIYDEHHDSTGRWKVVVNEKDALKAELKQRDDYIKQLEVRRCPQCSLGSSQPRPQVINNAMVEIRTTCRLRDPLRMPEDHDTVLKEGLSYFQGLAGKSYLHPIPHVTFKRAEEDGVALVLLRYDLPPNSDLIGQSFSEILKYQTIVLDLWPITGDYFRSCGFADETLRINGSDIYRTSEPLPSLDIPAGPRELKYTVSLKNLNLPK